MDSSVVSPKAYQSEGILINSQNKKGSSSDLLVLESLAQPKQDSAALVEMTFPQPSTKELILKLNEILREELPDGVESLDPKQFTPEATADRIVKQITGLFPSYAASNPELEDGEALSRFVEAVRSGVEQGFNSAVGTLEGIGAFEVEGLREQLDQTMTLVDQKLTEFEKVQRESIKVSKEAQEVVQTEFLSSAGSSVSSSERLDVQA